MALTVTQFRKGLPLSQRDAIKQIQKAAATAARRALEWAREIDRRPIGFGPPHLRRFFIWLQIQVGGGTVAADVVSKDAGRRPNRAGGTLFFDRGAL